MFPGSEFWCVQLPEPGSGGRSATSMEPGRPWQISTDYGVLFDGAGVAFRGTFLIDREGIVRHAVVNDLPLGRNIDDALRMVKALQHFEQNGEVCPANWQQGSETIKPTVDESREFFSKEYAVGS